MNRDEAITIIRDALKRRSGKPWSVTGGRGTAWGWITIDAPPGRRTAHFRLKEGAVNGPGNYEEHVNGTPGGFTPRAEREELGRLLGLGEAVDLQGVKVPAGLDYYQEYADRAQGKIPSVTGRAYWN